MMVVSALSSMGTNKMDQYLIIAAPKKVWRGIFRHIVVVVSAKSRADALRSLRLEYDALDERYIKPTATRLVIGKQYYI